VRTSTSDERSYVARVVPSTSSAGMSLCSGSTVTVTFCGVDAESAAGTGPGRTVTVSVAVSVVPFVSSIW
jgi:hypothetical protein